MTPRSENFNGLQPNQSVHQRIVDQFQGDWASRLSVDQLFVLIDGILPFEACLYYQVLPLFVEGNRLHLGMVSPEDTSASDYVRRIVSYLNYSLVSHNISSENLRVVLTAYLNHTGTQQQSSTQKASFSYGHHRHNARNQTDRQISPSERLTLVVDSPDDLYHAEENAEEAIGSTDAPPPVESAAAIVDLPADVVDLPADIVDLPAEEETVPAAETSPIEVQTTLESTTVLLAEPEALPQAELAQSVPLESLAEPTVPLPPPIHPSDAAVPPVVAVAPKPAGSTQELVFLNVNANYLDEPVEKLATLPPKELLDELLARVLTGGIGRLYFERHPNHGRVVWSQNGVLQSVLDRLDLDVFQSVIQELKMMACISLLPIDQPQQADIEYLYDRSQVLLRFRFMVNRDGEEVTVQVLRGAALKFYQQQQLSKLEKDAVSMAKQLQNKLHEIRARAYSNPSLLETQSKMLPKLTELLQNMEQELNALNGK